MKKETLSHDIEKKNRDASEWIENKNVTFFEKSDFLTKHKVFDDKCVQKQCSPQSSDRKNLN